VTEQQRLADERTKECHKSEQSGTAVFGMNVSESYQKSRQERGVLLVLGAGCSFTIRGIPPVA
jgi:hypothetical protein